MAKKITDLPLALSVAAADEIEIVQAGVSKRASQNLPWVFGGAVTVPSLTVTGFTSGRIPFAWTGGLLADSANLTFSGDALQSGVLRLIGGGAASVTIPSIGLENNRILGWKTAAGVAWQNFLWFTSADDFVIGTLNASRWLVKAAGHLIADQDNLWNIGAIGANRPANGYFGTSVATPRIDPVSSAIGFDVTPGAWVASSRVFEFAFPTLGMDDTGSAFLSFNARNSATSTWLYKSTDDAAKLTVSSNASFIFETAASGTVGNPITWLKQFHISHTASAVNFLQATGAATASAPQLLSQGSDVNVGMLLSTKGAGSFDFRTNALNQTQFVIAHTSSAVNSLQVTGGATGAPGTVTLSAQGSDANVDLAITPKGTGVLRFGTHTAIGAETVTGFITVKDSGGTSRKLAVVS